MESDREVLIWLHQRFINVYNENNCVDYIRRLRHIIEATKPKKYSRGQKCAHCNNSLKEMGKYLKNKTKFEQEMLDKS